MMPTAITFRSNPKNKYFAMVGFGISALLLLSNLMFHLAGVVACLVLLSSFRIRPLDNGIEVSWAYRSWSQQVQAPYVVAVAAVVSGFAWIVAPESASSLSFQSGVGASLAAFFPLLILLAPTNLSRFLAALVYYLVGSWTIIPSAGVFFGGSAYTVGLTLWSASAVVLAAAWTLPFMLCARFVKFPRWGAMMLGLLLVSVPPIGMIGWLSPLAAAGGMFPGTGLLGVGLLMLVWLAVGIWQSGGHGRWLAAAVAVLATAPLVSFSYKAPEAPAEWFAQGTSFGPAKYGDLETVKRQLQLIELVREPISGGAQVTILPEQVAGRLDKPLRLVWRLAMPSLKMPENSLLLVGQEIQLKPQGYLNGLIIYAGGEEAGAITARQPVPYAMWRPWSPVDHAPADWLKTNTLDLPRGNTFSKATFLFCFEEFLPWVAMSAVPAEGSKALIVVANAWWSAAAEQRIQAYHSGMWARLFGIPVIRAVNTAS